ncbi:DUF6412 domain-containing protein [Nocardia takedensis]|uniref:DUF6412 domain-containing protein n=1 Tax=Nocardia takedensis TaxID=259390 RepID=UPI00059393B8|nr:DUF6412 domain-containing protein [Nocardia takedensis]
MFQRVQVTAYAILALLLPALALLTNPSADSAALAVLGALAVSTVVLATMPPGVVGAAPPVAHAGPPSSARRRRRGSYLRQSNPDTAGRPRPRAPGAVAR